MPVQFILLKQKNEMCHNDFEPQEATKASKMCIAQLPRPWIGLQHIALHDLLYGYNQRLGGPPVPLP